ncbi:membrane transporter [Paraphaeosphaeria minitans]|uniref:Membrane transporter n=1 Tax=Paraphaeosphaeria minitans TaxID=565426 RepID=A0A9P6KPH5_9PLEO|nr:membrane transporter [Paraphaeosphaeria minitans]
MAARRGNGHRVGQAKGGAEDNQEAAASCVVRRATTNDEFFNSSRGSLHTWPLAARRDAIQDEAPICSGCAIACASAQRERGQLAAKLPFTPCLHSVHFRAPAPAHAPVTFALPIHVPVQRSQASRTICLKVLPLPAASVTSPAETGVPGLSMSFFNGPIQSLRLRNLDPSPDFMVMTSDPYSTGNGFLEAFKHKRPPHSSHPDFANLTLLVFEAVMEVVCVSLPGYIVARMGQFDADAQKFVANLNTQLFTPCLIFTKLASQLSADKLVELGVIPFIFVVQLIISYLAALIISKLYGFSKRGRNFVVAMAVFGNSNSLPISLVISLSKTLSGLHWDRIPGDNDNEVAARGILYLLIFQQLGQLVRWTWGFNVLLAPADACKDEDDDRNSIMENGEYSDGEADRLLDDSHSDYESGNVTSYATSISTTSSDSDSITQRENAQSAATFITPTIGNAVVKGPGNMNGNAYPDEGVQNGTVFPYKADHPPKGPKKVAFYVQRTLQRFTQSIRDVIARASRRVFLALPVWLQRMLAKLYHYTAKFLGGCWEFMNPPLWAMLAAIVVASIPPVQHAFFDPGTFLSNSVTRAVSQSGGVAVPLILVVLGANLARNTLPDEGNRSMEDIKVEKKLVIASLVSRMLIPTIIMAPLLALTAKFVPVSILDDPIFVIVCFLLTGAPSALQLAQICQINNVYMGAMSNLLFQSYVVWILPSTLVLVMLALETVEWAGAS